ncbi:hypothetical protein BYT27DRAFT_7336770 [Phlegmacium glaucopus]|nr:hypothetical protein BYT27DRAFT_7336770 [Phlegmacium glaucopus]
MRSLGVRVGVGLSSVVPLAIPLTYFFLLPRSSAFLYPLPRSAYEDILTPAVPTTSLPYTPLATSEDEAGEEEGSLPSGPKRGVSLSASDKWHITRPLFMRYMLPLSLMYESAIGFFGDESESLSIFFVFTLISLEGLCGGSAYVNVFYRVNQEPPDPNTNHDIEKTRQEREFKIGFSWIR